MTVTPVPIPERRASTLTARPRWPLGASSTTSAVATPATRTSKQTAMSRRRARSASVGANALTKLASEKPATPPAIRRRRPKRSANVASGSAPREPMASTDPRSDSAGVLAWKSLAIAGSASTTTEPSKAVSTTAAPAQTSVTSAGRHEQRASRAWQPQLDRDRCGEHDRRREGRKAQLNAQPAGTETQPPRAPDCKVGDRERGGEWQEANEDVGAHPCPAVWNTRELQPRWSFWSGDLRTHHVRRLLRLPVPVRLPGGCTHRGSAALEPA